VNTSDLLQNYFVTAVRNLATHKLYSFINIAGLSVGLTCAIFIVLFLRDELSYDRWIPDSSNIYRIEVTFHLSGRALEPFATAPFPLLPTMQEHIPEVKAVTHLLPEPMTVTVGDKQFLETIAFVDPGFLQVIRLPLAAGNPTTVLSRPESVVLSQRIARKYFGDSSPLGRILRVTGSGIMCARTDTACLNAAHPVAVTGVLKDLPDNTQLAVDVLIPNTSKADDDPVSYRQHSWSSTDGVYDYL
jgi:putative ABC transport system permease protein